MRLFIDWDGCPFLVCPTCWSEIQISEATHGLDLAALVHVAEQHDCAGEAGRSQGAAH